jgi:hypothetical protein
LLLVHTTHQGLYPQVGQLYDDWIKCEPFFRNVSAFKFAID